MATKIVFENVNTFAVEYDNNAKTTKVVEWALVQQLFDLCSSEGEMYVPESLGLEVYKWFGKATDKSEEESILRVEKQNIVRVINKWTHEQTLFNTLRAKRPLNNEKAQQIPDVIPSMLEELPKLCDFCSPQIYTTIDTWGRVERDTCVTASNIAKYDAFHGMIIFKDHSPLKYNKGKLDDTLSACEEWFQCAYDVDKNAVFPMLSWACKGDTTGVSKHHNHAHMMLGKKFAYGRYSFLSSVASNYARTYPGKNYFQDLITAQISLGLGKAIGNAAILVNFTPFMGHELQVISWNYDQDFFDALHMAIEILLTRFKATTFNIGIQYPQLDPGGIIRRRFKPEHLNITIRSPDGPMPFIAYVGDRSELSHTRVNSDFCSMRMNGTSVVAVDPFRMGKVVNMSEFLWK